MNTMESSSIEVVASSGIFQIEFFHETGAADYNRLMEISNSLEKDFGKKFVLSHKTIESILTILAHCHMWLDIVMR